MHLDRGYDNGVVRALCAEVGLDDLIVAKKRIAGEGRVKVAVSLGMRWPVERTNSWLSNSGQLRRNTDHATVEGQQMLDRWAIATPIKSHEAEAMTQVDLEALRDLSHEHLRRLNALRLPA